MTDLPAVAVQYSLPRSLPEWELPEVPVPESPEHDEIADRLRSVLLAWILRSGIQGAVRRNLAIRWDAENPRVGVDPDVCFMERVPPGFLDGEVESLKLWLPGHEVPKLAIEIVSRHHPYKDYGRVQEKYAAVGVQELWVFDPRRFGPRAHGGPVLLQLWERSPQGVLVRKHFGDDPARSTVTSAWLIPRPGFLSVADDVEGRKPWLTLAEQEAQRAEHALQQAEQAQAEVARLSAEIETLRAKRDPSRG